MSNLTAIVKNAERMMTYGIATRDGIELTFADGCKGVIPFSDIPEVGKPSELMGIELPNPYQVNIHSAKRDTVELPWDFVRHYCDSSYQSKAEAFAATGRQSIGNRIRAIRETSGMTQAALAALAKIGRVTEVRIENGNQSPRYDTLVAIAQALRRPMTDFLTD